MCMVVERQIQAMEEEIMVNPQYVQKIKEEESATASHPIVNNLRKSDDDDGWSRLIPTQEFI